MLIGAFIILLPICHPIQYNVFIQYSFITPHQSFHNLNHNFLLSRANESSGLEHSKQRAQNKMREYLSVYNCLTGLQMVSQALFGISLQRETINPYEGWLQNHAHSSNDSRNSEEDAHLVQKFSVIDDKTGEKMGTVFFDLFERNHKFPGSAHFTVQCGCERTSVRHSGSQDSLGTHRQLPIVALVFHFHAPQGVSSSSGGGINSRGTDDVLKNCLLTLKEVETLHHEWGHALHSLLSQTRFQHLSGTRGGSDFVEVSSVCYWAVCCYVFFAVVRIFLFFSSFFFVLHFVSCCSNDSILFTQYISLGAFSFVRILRSLPRNPLQMGPPLYHRRGGAQSAPGAGIFAVYDVLYSVVYRSNSIVCTYFFCEVLLVL